MFWEIATMTLVLVLMAFGGLEVLAQDQPVAEPTQPVAEPTQPGSEPTQPGSEPTQPGSEPTQPVSTAQLDWRSPLVIVQCMWMILVTVGAAAYAYLVGRRNSYTTTEKELRGLNLPRGSLRGILALATIGSFVNVMVLGAPVLGDHFESVLAAFGTLTGSIVGFYFGTRGATPPPDK